METVAKRIKRIREMRNYSQEYLASMVGISQPAYAKMEQGKTKITLERLKQISEILQVEQQEFLEDVRINDRMDNDLSFHLTENLIQEINKWCQKLMKPLERKNIRLQKEIERLQNLLDNKL